MDKEYFLNAGIPHPLHFEASMSAWQSLLPAQPPESFLNQNWGKSMDQYNTQFDSAIGSIVSSSHVALDSVVSNDRFAIRELIGKLGGTSNSGEISPPFMAGETATAPYGGGANTSCYGTTLNSQPKLLRTPTTDQSFKEKTQNPGNSIPSNFRFPALPSDHGFSDTAAIKFSCFENRTFNGRTNPIGLNNTEFPLRSDAPFPVTGNITRVLSSPSLPAAGFPTQNKFSTETQMETRSTRCSILGSDKKLTESSAPASTSNNNSSVSEQIPIGEIEPKTPSELNSRKRKFASKGKQRDDSSIQPIIASKVTESEIDLNSKRSKLKEKCGNGNLDLKTEDEKRGSSTNSANPKANEPPKDYIHVRARRGQATDSHSLAERVRREKIGERMKLLQDLVPGCSKVTGKALMLDEIINYVQSLQRQVEFLSMKLASVNPSVDVKMDGLIPKNPNSPLDSSGAASYGHQAQRSPQLSTQINIVDGFGCFSQFQSFSEDDLQSIVQMGFLPKSRVQS